MKERERDVDRFLTFIDAAVAIAITLLVLPLVDLTAEVRDGGSVGGLVGDHLSEFGAFLLSFVVIARLWYAQHYAVRHLVVMDAVVCWLLMAWTLTIVFLPFPTALVADEGGQAVTKLLYIGTMALNMSGLAVLERVPSARPHLTDVDSDIERTAASSLLANVVLLLIALGLTLLFPVLSYFPLLLLALDDPITRLLGHRGGSR